MRKILLFAMALPCLYSMTSAQKVELSRQVYGDITEKITHAPASFATVRISPLGTKDSLTYNQVADSKGRFHIALPEAPKYRILVTSVGFKNYMHEFTFPAQSNKYKLKDILLDEDAHELNEVSVSAMKRLVSSDVDRLTYSIKEDPRSRTSSLLEMLRRVPLVTVDGKENVQIKGSSNFKIYMNGKPSPMMNGSPKDVLRGIPASSIKKVEVITDPGVKFDADNQGAILNIVTDDMKLGGYTATLNAHLGTNKSWSLGGFYTAKYGRLGVTLRYNHVLSRNIDGLFFTETETNTTKSRIDGSQEDKFNGNFGTGTITYEIDSLNLISVSGKLARYNMNTSKDSRDKLWVGDVLSRIYNQHTDLYSKRGGYNINVDYQRNTRKPDELFTFSYLYDHSPLDTRTELSRYLLSPDHEVEIAGTYQGQLSKSSGKMDEHTFQVDYTTPFGKGHSIETGLKYIYRISTSDPLYFIRNEAMAEWKPGSIFDKGLRGTEFKHTQNIFAGYLGYGFKTKAYSLKTGVRIETGNLKAQYMKQNDADFKYNFTDWVPQFSLGYNINQSQQLTLSYNFRIARPALVNLNPYRDQNNEYAVSYGNPDLKSVKLHDVGLRYSIFSPKFNIQFSTNYNFTNNSIEMYSFKDSVNPQLIHRTYGNVGRVKKLNFNLYGGFNPLDWLQLGINANGGHTWARNTKLDISDHFWTGIVYSNINVTLPHDYYLSLYYGFFSFDRGLQSPVAYYNDFNSISISKSLLQKKLSIGLELNSPFRKRVTYKRGLVGEGFKSYSESTNLDRVLTMTLSYRFGEMKSQIKRVTRGIVNDDLMKSGSDNQGKGK
ncbi:TonB-dependent receptor domain-containing protein [Porphyromonas pogonae]|uniref:TonB-dependent receptor domain-containing protein n=1 Tax=Porphyromonas pogonae TaxID=867595 RepID=UPI002E760ED6|nr:TonB-dependent receptor [Porphyromonas pogonae]